MGTLVEKTLALTMERKGQDSYRGSSGLGPDMGLWNRAQMQKWAVGTADPGRTDRERTVCLDHGSPSWS